MIPKLISRSKLKEEIQQEEDKSNKPMRPWLLGQAEKALACKTIRLESIEDNNLTRQEIVGGRFVAVKICHYCQK